MSMTSGDRMPCSVFGLFHPRYPGHETCPGTFFLTPFNACLGIARNSPPITGRTRLLTTSPTLAALGSPWQLLRLPVSSPRPSPATPAPLDRSKPLGRLRCQLPEALDPDSSGPGPLPGVMAEVSGGDAAGGEVLQIPPVL